MKKFFINIDIFFFISNNLSDKISKYPNLKKIEKEKFKNNKLIKKILIGQIQQIKENKENKKKK